MSEEHIIRRSLGGPRRTADWSRSDAMTDADIQAGIDADPDAAPVVDGEWFAAARMIEPDQNKKSVTIRLDLDVFSFFKGYGKGYQTRINKVLRVFMEHEQAHRRGGE